VGAIGCGGRGSHHLSTLVSLRDSGEPIDLVGVCDVYRPRLDRAAAQCGAGFRTQAHEELLARGDIDAVCIATPDHAHGHQALDAVRAGKDVYCEKPLVHWRQIGLAERLEQAVAETGRVVQVGCQRMSSSVYAQAKALVDAGDLGRPILAETGYYRIGDWGERGMPIDDPAARPGPDLLWDRFLGDAPRREFDASRFFRWRMYWDYSGGPGTDNYVHFYTPLAYVLSLGYPERVVATGGKYRYEEREVPDTFNMIVDYPGKFSVLCNGTQGNDYASQGSGDAPILRGWDATMTFEGAEIVCRPTSGSGRAEKRVRIESATSEPVFWKEFLSAVRTRGRVRSDVHLGASVATTLQMAIIAMREDRVVHYDTAKKSVI
jgi:predicted dehydrogenase